MLPPIVWAKFLDPGPQCWKGVGYRCRSLPHPMSISSVSASNLTSLCGVADNWMKIHRRGLYTYIESDSLRHTHYCWSPEPVSTWYGCKAQAQLYSLSVGAAAGRFSPQILTDGLDGSDLSPSAEARETGSNIERTEICVYHCQNRYTAWHLRDGKLCQFIKRLKKPGHFTKLLRKERKLHSVRKRTYSAGRVDQRDWWFLWWVMRNTGWCTC